MVDNNDWTEEKWIDQVRKAQKQWGDAVVAKDAEQLLSLYDFDTQGKGILFKPTLASQIQFRNSKKAARSYFIAGDVDFPEDHGFINKGWKTVRFEGDIKVLDNVALAMGNYFFLDPDTNQEKKVEYTFVYRRVSDDVKIVLHHSSLPYEA